MKKTVLRIITATMIFGSSIAMATEGTESTTLSNESSPVDIEQPTGTSKIQYKSSLLDKKDEDSKFGMDVFINSDAFFGFAPAAFGSYSISETMAFTFYGIFWSGGTAGAWGNWTEFGVGVNFDVADGAVSINPALGVLGGSLLSGLGNPQFPDGIVPNLTVGLDTDLLEGEIYFGYYMGLSEGEGATTTLDYIHYWTSLGVKTGGFFSAGLLWEHLFLAGGSEITETQEYYQSFGPYIQFADPSSGTSLRFSMGANLADKDERAFSSDSFYKLTLGFSL